MADLYANLTDFTSQPSPGAQWVYASDQYAIYEITPSAVPNTRAKWDRVGHTIMNSINPDYVMIRSKDGVILMVVGNTRWDAASLKQTMDIPILVDIEEIDVDEYLDAINQNKSIKSYLNGQTITELILERGGISPPKRDNKESNRGRSTEQ